MPRLGAFLLAAVGLYGVTSVLSARRTREMGVRLALGARESELLTLVLRQGSRQVIVGLVVGLLFAAVAYRGLAAVGLEVIPWDFRVTAAVCLTLGVTGIVAVMVPAWRSTRVDPVIALQAE